MRLGVDRLGCPRMGGNGQLSLSCPGRNARQTAVEEEGREEKRRGNLERSTLQLTPSETSCAGLHRDERDRRGGGKKVGSNNGNGMGRGIGEERSENRDNL